MSDLPTMLNYLKQIDEFLEEEIQKRLKLAPEDMYQSEQIDKLATALAAAQGKYPVIPFNRVAPSWSNEYSDLDNVLYHVRPMLSENKLAFTQWTRLTNDGECILHTQLTHASGQWQQSRIKINPSRNDIMSFDSYLANMRRTQGCNLLGVTISGDPKDDGGEIDLAINFEKSKEDNSPKLVRTKESYDCISKEQLEELQYELDGYTDMAEKLMQTYTLHTLASMPKTVFKTAIKKVRENKQYYKKN